MRLIVYACKEDMVGVEVLLGEVLLFDADVIHAGAAYMERANTRLHLDVEG